MNPWLALIAGVLIGAAAAALALRARYAARIASAETERGVLRERVIDLESSLAEDLETAAMLAPLKDALVRVERHVGALERDRVEQFGAVHAVLTRVEDETAGLSRATSSLAGSLRASSVRGAWGEIQVRRVLEASGMLRHCDFEEQVSVTHDDATFRPDVVVRLPGDRTIVIDAKAPMTAFLAAQAEDLDDDKRAQLLRDHSRALRGHVQALAGKSYWSAFAQSPQFVVCFVPTEAMLAAALSAHPGLHEHAMSSKVVLVGPASLFALLRTVALAWQHEAITDDAKELLVVGRELAARIGTMGGHLASLGGSLHRSVENYNRLVGAIESRVLVTARRLEEMGIAESAPAPTQPVVLSPRPLSASELLDAVAAEQARPELDLELGQPSQRAADAS